jgi:hypothetical protein
MSLNRDAIVGVKDYGLKEVEVPEWGGSVYLRKWTGKDRSLFWSKSVKASDEGAEMNWDTLFENQTLVVAMSLCDENGDKLFTTTEEDLAVLGAKDGDVIQRLYTESLLINGLAQISLEESAKNSSPAQSDDSISDLPESSGAQSESSLTE